MKYSRYFITILQKMSLNKRLKENCFPFNSLVDYKMKRDGSLGGLFYLLFSFFSFSFLPLVRRVQGRALSMLPLDKNVILELAHCEK